MKTQLEEYQRLRWNVPQGRQVRFGWEIRTMREHGSLFVRVSRLKGDNITGCDGVISMDDLTRQAFAYHIKYCRRMIRSHMERMK